MCKVVSREPRLHALGNGTLVGLSALATGQWRGECLSSDVAMCDLLGDESKNAYFDTVVFNPLPPDLSHHGAPMQVIYFRGEEMRRHYQQRICEVEYCSFTLLVFSTTGKMGRTAGVTAQIEENRKEAYSQNGVWTRTLVRFFSLLWSSIPALCGCRTMKTIELSSLTNSKTKYVKHTL